MIGQLFILERQKTTHVHQRILLGAHHAAIGQVKHFAGDVAAGLFAVAFLVLLDEPGIFGNPAGIENEQHPVAAAKIANLARVGHAHGLAAAGIVGHRQNDRADIFAAALADERVHALNVGIALERKITFG